MPWRAGAVDSSSSAAAAAGWPEFPAATSTSLLPVPAVCGRPRPPLPARGVRNVTASLLGRSHPRQCPYLPGAMVRKGPSRREGGSRRRSSPLVLGRHVERAGERRLRGQGAPRCPQRTAARQPGGVGPSPSFAAWRATSCSCTATTPPAGSAWPSSPTPASPRGILARLYPWHAVGAGEDPWEVLLWANGRIDPALPLVAATPTEPAGLVPGPPRCHNARRGRSRSRVHGNVEEGRPHPSQGCRRKAGGMRRLSSWVDKTVGTGHRHDDHRGRRVGLHRHVVRTGAPRLAVGQRPVEQRRHRTGHLARPLGHRVRAGLATRRAAGPGVRTRTVHGPRTRAGPAHGGRDAPRLRRVLARPGAVRDRPRLDRALRSGRGGAAVAVL